MALVVARQRAGLAGHQGAVVFCSVDAHVSLGKALAVMGLPPGSLRPLPVDGAGRLLPDVRRSDHSPFWDQGYAALMATDTSFLRNPHYHQATDTIASLDLPFLTAVTTGLAEALSAL
jgi:hypothetical protein